MADFQSEINVNIDTSQALASIRNLQKQISQFHASIIKGSAQATAASKNLQQNMVNSINAGGQFSASMRRISTSTETFTNALEKNKLSFGEYFRYAGGATKRFGKSFRNEMAVIDKTARERVKTLQTQYVKMGRDANGAMQSIAVRPLKLDMENLATQTAVNAQKQQIFNQLLRQGSTNLLNWGKNTQWAGRQLMVGFTIPLTIFGVQAAKAFQNLEEQTIKFKRVYGDLFTTDLDTEKALKDVRGLADEFTKFGIAVEDTIGLAASVAQIGNTGAQLRAQVEEATRLSVLGGMEQQEALNTTISLTNAFGVSAEDLTKKVNFLNAAENQTILSIQDFTEAVPKAGSVVKQLGGGVEELALFLTAMREGGINASQSANALKSSLARLINPTEVAKEKLGAMGIDILGIVNDNAGDLTGTIVNLAQALDNLNPLDKSRAIEQLFGKFQFARMSTLMNNIIKEGSQASQTLELMSMSAEDLGKIATRELGRVEESVSTKFRKSLEQLQAALAPIGEEFLKAVTPILEFATKFLESFNKMSDGMKNFTVITAAVLGAVAPVALMVIGLIGNGVANLIKFVAVIRSGFMKAGKSSTVLGEQMNYMTQEQLEALSVSASLEQSHNRLTQSFTAEKVAVDSLTKSYTQAIIAAQKFATANPGMIRPTQGTKKLAGGTANVKKYNKGTFNVPGPKGAGDIVPAMLSPGEAVIPAKQADKYRGLIKGMVGDNIPGFRFGIASMMGRSRVATRMGSQTFMQSLRSNDLSYKSGFATGTGADFTDRMGRPMKQHQLMRRQAENKLYGTPIGSNDPSMRPVYGSVASSPLQRIIAMIFGGRKGRQFGAVTNPMASNLDQYGDISLIGKQSMNRRASTFVGDTLLKYSKNPAWVKGTAPMIGSTAEQRKQSGFDAFNQPFGATQSGAGRSLNQKPSYIEAQTMGGFNYKEIDKVIARDPRLRKQLRSELKQAGLGGVRVRGEGFVAGLMAKLGIPGFNQGVFSVPGSGSGDTVPAMLTPGEAVIPAPNAEKYRGLIKSIISDKVPGFNQGTPNVPMFGEYAIRLQDKTQNMQKMSGQVNDPNQVLAPLSMRIGETRGISPTQKSVQAGKLDPIAKEYETIVKKFTNKLNKEFETTYKNVKDTNERFKKSWKAAGQSVKKDVDKITSKAERGVVRKTFGLSPDTHATMPTEPRRAGEKKLQRGRKSAFTDGPYSYSYVGKGARSLFQRRTGIDGSSYQMGHVNAPKQVPLDRILNNPKASNAAKQAGELLGYQADAVKKDTEATKKKTAATKKSTKVTKEQSQAAKRSTQAYRDPVTGRFAKRPEPAAVAAPVVNNAEQQQRGRGMAALGGSAMAASFALSSLAGAGSMMGGAIGEVSGKLFMISSVATSLIFVIQALTQAKVAELAKTRLATAKAAVSRNVVTGGVAARGGVGGMLGKLAVGITRFMGPIGIATTAVALFGGAIKLAADKQEETRKEIEGLGNVASMSSDKLEKLGQMFNVQAKTIDYATRGVAPGGDAVSGSEIRSASEVAAQPEFAEAFADEISAIESATAEQAERALNALAYQLKASGFEVDAVNAIIRAIAVEAGRTDIQLKFANIDISTDSGAREAERLAQDAADAYNEKLEENTKDLGGMLGTELQKTPEVLKQVEETAGVFKSLIDAGVTSLEDGTMTAEEFDEFMGSAFDKIENAEQPSLLLENIAEKMGIGEVVSQLDSLEAKTLRVQMAAAGINFRPEDLSDIIELQAKMNVVGADREAIQKELNDIYSEYVGMVNEAADAQERANEKSDIDEQEEAFDFRLKSIESEIDAINEQSAAYDYLIGIGYSTEDALKAVSDANFMAAYSNSVDAEATRDAADAYLEYINAIRESNFERAKRTRSGSAKKSPFQQTIEDLQEQRKEMRNSLTAYNRLRDAGLSIGDAFRAAQDSAAAAALASTKVGTSSWNKLLNLIKDVNRELAEGELKSLLIEGAADMQLKKDFAEVVPILEDMGLELEDVQEILNNPAIAQALIDDLKDGSLDAKNLKTFIDQIPTRKNVDILFNLSTEEGVRNQFDQMFSQAMEIFDFEEAVIRDKYEDAIEAQEDIIEKAQDDIETLQDNIAEKQRSLELQYTRPISVLQEEAQILSNDLALIEDASSKINEKFDKRLKALAEVEKLNKRITDSQRKQLSLADALSQGDISAAAGIMQEMRQESAESAAVGLQDALKASRDAEIAGLRSASGMSSEEIAQRQFDIQQEIFQLEQKSKPLLEDIEELQDRIYSITQGRLKTAEDTLKEIREQEKAELDAIDAKREAWEDAKLFADEAKFAAEKYNDVLELGADLVAGLLTDWEAIKSKVVTLTIRRVYEGGGGSSGGSDDDGDTSTPPPDNTGSNNGSSGSSDSNPPALDPGAGDDPTFDRFNPSEDPQTTYIPGGYRKPGQSIIDGRIVGDSRGPAGETPPSLVSGRDDERFNRFLASGGQVKGSMKGGMPAYQKGGKVFSTDTVPAMLTPGEYVIKKDSVDKLGLDFLNTLNSGEQGPTEYRAKGGFIPGFLSGKFTSNNKPKSTSPFAQNLAKQYDDEGIDWKPKPDVAAAMAADKKKSQDEIKEAQKKPGIFQSFEKGFQDIMEKVAENPVVKKIGEAYSADNFGGQVFRGVTAALSTPAEIMGSVAKSTVDAMGAAKDGDISKVIAKAGPGQLLNSIAEGTSNAFSGVADVKNQKDSMFNKAAQSAIENNLFGAQSNPEMASFARIIGGTLNVAGDPLTYLGIGLANKVAKSGSIASKFSKGQDKISDLMVKNDTIAKNFPGITGAILNRRADAVANRVPDPQGFFKPKDTLQSDKYQTFLDNIKKNPKDTRVIIAAKEEAARNILKNRNFKSGSKSGGRQRLEDKFLGQGVTSDFAGTAYGALYNQKLAPFHQGLALSAANGYGNIKLIMPPSVYKRTRVYGGGDSLLNNAQKTQSLSRILSGNPAEMERLLDKAQDPNKFMEAQILGGLQNLPKNTRYTLTNKDQGFLVNADISGLEFTRKNAVGDGNLTRLVRQLINFTGDDVNLMKKFRFADAMDISDAQQMKEFRKILNEAEEGARLGTGKVKIPQYETFKEMIENYSGGLGDRILDLNPIKRAMGGSVPNLSLGKTQYKAMGGMMRGMNTDTVPAMLTPGEFVMNRRASQKFGPLLKSMNSNFRMPSMQQPSFRSPQSVGAPRINSNTNVSNNSETVYNYNLNLNVNGSQGNNPQAIANTVIDRIKQMDSQRIRKQVI